MCVEKGAVVDSNMPAQGRGLGVDEKWSSEDALGLAFTACFKIGRQVLTLRK